MFRRPSFSLFAKQKSRTATSSSSNSSSNGQEPDDFLLTMSSASTISSQRPMSRDYDTGFPESFAAHTTSMRHPDANTGPGACISSEDIDPSKTLQRSRRSLMHKHRRTTSHGVITAEMRAQYVHNDSGLSLGPIDSTAELDATQYLPSHDKEGMDGMGRILSKDSYEPGSPPKTADSETKRPDSRRGAMLQKWRFLKS
jgi:hypothetical protein